MEIPKGKFFDTLNRSNDSIKKDRAESIAEDSAIAFERNVQDLATSIRRKVRERENMNVLVSRSHYSSEITRF